MSAKVVREDNRQDVAKTESSLPGAQAEGTTIVAIGASAGGIEALTELMNHLPSDTGMAFVLVQHLDPKHHSILTELLARKTAMPVTEVSEGLAVEPNHVYVIPPNAMMSISGQTLHLGPRENHAGCTCPWTISCALWLIKREIVPLALSCRDQARTELWACLKFKRTGA